VLRIGVNDLETTIALSEFHRGETAEESGVTRPPHTNTNGTSRRKRSSCEKSVLGLLLVVGVAASAAAQTVQTDPLQCWWRTSAGAVRVGEPFTVVLTCAVLETDAATVAVDQTRLEPSVVQFAPFEGARRIARPPICAPTIAASFQYEYRLRLIADGMFGKDAGAAGHQAQLPRPEQGRTEDLAAGTRIRPTCWPAQIDARPCRWCRPTPADIPRQPRRARPSATSTSARFRRQTCSP